MNVYLSDFQQENGKHLENVGFFEGKNAVDLVNHLASEVNEVRVALAEGGPVMWFNGPDRKPEGVAAELADVVLLALDVAYFLGVDLEAALKEKNEYNVNRRKVN